MQNVNFDLEPCDLPPEIFTYGINFRLLNNKIRGFNMSKTLATQTGMTNAWLEEQGLLSIRNLWMKVQGYV